LAQKKAAFACGGNTAMEGKDLRSSLHSLRDHQEQSLQAIQDILDTYEISWVAPRGERCGNSTRDMQSFQQTQTSSRLFGYDIQYNTDRNSVSTLPEGELDMPKTSLNSSNFQAMVEGSRFKNFLKGSQENFEDINFKDLRVVCRWLVNKPQFDWLMGVIIFVNSVCIGIDTQKSISRDLLPGWPSEVIDWIFISVYCVELLMRFLAFGRANFMDGWFLFDLVLVSTGIFGNIINFMLAENEGDSSTFQSLLVFRAFRLLRLVRAIRMLHVFRTAWRLVYGLLTSGNAMLSTFFILLLTLYIFACLGVELITKDHTLQAHPDTAQLVAYYFGSLPRTLLTMMSFVSADSISSVYIPICVVKPQLIMFFIAVVLTVSVSLMNLVTAVLVEGALANAANDKELSQHDLKQKIKKFAPKIMDIFEDIDKDRNGVITRKELGKVKLDQLPIDLSNTYASGLEDLFDMLDVDGRGQLSLVEFADGFLGLLTMDVPIHTMKIFKLLHLHSQTLDQIKTKLLVLNRSMRSTASSTATAIADTSTSFVESF